MVYNLLKVRKETTKLWEAAWEGGGEGGGGGGGVLFQDAQLVFHSHGSVPAGDGGWGTSGGWGMGGTSAG